MAELAASRIPPEFHVPRRLGLNLLDKDSALLLLEPLPVEASSRRQRTAYPDAAVTAYRGPVRFVARSDVDNLSWWEGFMRVTHSHGHSFRRAVDRALADGVAVGLVHGDLAPHNMLSHGSHTWIFDWEYASEDGPAEVDRWFFHDGNLRKPTVDASALINVAYLASCGNQTSLRTVSAWPSTPTRRWRAGDSGPEIRPR